MLYEEIWRGCKRYHQRCADYDHSYDKFFKEKCQPKWDNPDALDEAEVNNLIVFLNRFQAFGPFNIGKSKPENFEKLPQVLENLQPLRHSAMLDVDFDDASTCQIIRENFVILARCGPDDKCYDVAASKILHAINPELFVMWDNRIRNKQYWRHWPSELCWYWPGYAEGFLPKVQQRMRMAINELVNDRELSSDEEAVRFFTDYCKHENSLAKIIDEYHFVNTR